MTYTKLTDDIWEWLNVSQDQNILLSDLIKENWRPYNNDGGGSTLIGKFCIIDKNHNKYKEIVDIFSKCLNDYLPAKDSGLDSLNMDTNKFLVRDYGSGSYMTQHSDGYSYVTKNGEEVKPLYTAIFYLNDDYEGGEISFTDQNVSIKPKANSVIIFPSKYAHSVNEVKSGNRYMTQTYIHAEQMSQYQEKK